MLGAVLGNRRGTARRWLWGTAAMLVVGLGIAWIAFGASGGTRVEAVRAEIRPIQEVIEERGITRLPETHLMTMPINARIEAITLREGTAVEKGQVVARVVDSDVQLPLQQAQAAVDRIEAAIKTNADTSVEKTAQLQAEKFVESMQSTVEAAEARVEAGQAQYSYAEANLARVQRLYESNVQTQDDYERARLQKVEAEVSYRQDRLVYASLVAMQAATDLMPKLIEQYIARKRLTQAELEKQRAEAMAQLLIARENERLATITSPVDGVVLERMKSDEQYLAAGTPLLEIGDLSQLEIEADVLSLEVTRAAPGDPVEIFLGSTYGEPIARGTLERIYPAAFTKLSSLGVEEQRVKVIISLSAEEIDRLRRDHQMGVGFRVRVRIITAAKDDALVVPRSSVVQDTAGRWQLYVIRKGRLLRQKVEVGMMNDEHVEVVEGIAADEWVVRTPDVDLEPGQRVEIVETR